MTEVIKASGCLIADVHYGDERRSFYAPRWFRRQNKGRDYRALAQSLLRECIVATIRKEQQPA